MNRGSVPLVDERKAVLCRSHAFPDSVPNKYRWESRQSPPGGVRQVNYPALLRRSRSALGRSLRTGLSVDRRTCRPVPVHGRGVDARRRFTGGSVRPSLATPHGLQRSVRDGRPKLGWSAHSTLIPGGLKRIHLLYRDASSSPSLGPVYGGPYIGSVLAPMYYHVLRSHGSKRLRTRFLPGLLARFARSLRPGPPRYRRVNGLRSCLRIRPADTTRILQRVPLTTRNSRCHRGYLRNVLPSSNRG